MYKRRNRAKKKSNEAKYTQITKIRSDSVILKRKTQETIAHLAFFFFTLKLNFITYLLFPLFGRWTRWKSQCIRKISVWWQPESGNLDQIAVQAIRASAIVARWPQTHSWMYHGRRILRCRIFFFCVIACSSLLSRSAADYIKKIALARNGWTEEKRNSGQQRNILRISLFFLYYDDAHTRNKYFCVLYILSLCCFFYFLQFLFPLNVLCARAVSFFCKARNAALGPLRCLQTFLFGCSFCNKISSSIAIGRSLCALLLRCISLHWSRGAHT